VVRFPVERRARPTLDLMREIAPDVREVLAIAEAFYLEVPVPDLRARIDAETARYILEQFGGAGGMPTGALEALLDPVVAAAVAASRAAHDQAGRAADALLAVREAEAAGGFWLDPLRERADVEGRRMAGLLIEAHARVEEAEGVARAVALTRRGEVWTPRDFHAEQDALFALAARRVG
jgi:hypothetical protein